MHGNMESIFYRERSLLHVPALLNTVQKCKSGACIITTHHIQLFRERLSYKRGKTNATKPNVIIGNGDFTVA